MVSGFHTHLSLCILLCSLQLALHLSPHCVHLVLHRPGNAHLSRDLSILTTHVTQVIQTNTLRHDYIYSPTNRREDISLIWKFLFWKQASFPYLPQQVCMALDELCVLLFQFGVALLISLSLFCLKTCHYLVDTLGP